MPTDSKPAKADFPSHLGRDFPASTSMSSSKKRTRAEAKAAEEDDDAADEDDDMNGEGSPPLPSGRADLERAVQFNPDDEGDDDDDDEEGGGNKRSRTTGGSTASGARERRKIQIEYIKDKSRRHITFSKRKAGIMKKAFELSTLTGTQVLLLVVSETGLVYTFTTPKLQPLVTQTEGKNLIQACLNAPEGETPSGIPAGSGGMTTGTRVRAASSTHASNNQPIRNKNDGIAFDKSSAPVSAGGSVTGSTSTILANSPPEGGGSGARPTSSHSTSSRRGSSSSKGKKPDLPQQLVEDQQESRELTPMERNLIETARRARSAAIAQGAPGFAQPQQQQPLHHLPDAAEAYHHQQQQHQMHLPHQHQMHQQHQQHHHHQQQQQQHPSNVVPPHNMVTSQPPGVVYPHYNPSQPQTAHLHPMHPHSQQQQQQQQIAIAAYADYTDTTPYPSFDPVAQQKLDDEDIVVPGGGIGGVGGGPEPYIIMANGAGVGGGGPTLASGAGSVGGGYGGTGLQGGYATGGGVGGGAGSEGSTPGTPGGMVYGSGW